MGSLEISEQNLQLAGIVFIVNGKQNGEITCRSTIYERDEIWMKYLRSQLSLHFD
jgi:hypothetical protein